MIVIANQKEFDAFLDGLPINEDGSLVTNDSIEIGEHANCRLTKNLFVTMIGKMWIRGSLSIYASLKIEGFFRIDGRLKTSEITVNGKPIATGVEARRNLAIIAKAALKPGALAMNQVHSCGTSHCIAGWAVSILPGGKELEKTVGWYKAGLMLLGFEAALHFHDDDEAGRKFLEKYA